MCDPVSMTVLTVASTVSSLYAQQQAADAQADYNARQYANTMQARAANINQTNLRQVQEREASVQKLEENGLAARAAQATARTAAGESGISGLSVDALLSDLGNRAQRFNSSVETNYDYTNMALENQRQNINIDAASAINQLKTPQAPDYLGAGLRIAGAAANYDTQVNKGAWFGNKMTYRTY